LLRSLALTENEIQFAKNLLFDSSTKMRYTHGTTTYVKRGNTVYFNFHYNFSLYFIKLYHMYLRSRLEAEQSYIVNLQRYILYCSGVSALLSRLLSLSLLLRFSVTAY